MKNILKKILPILALVISTSIFANYMVKIQLEPNGINMNLPTEIVGNAQLDPSIINRGESSTISWNYDYATEISIDGLGTYGKSGSVQVSPLASRNYTINAVYGSLSKTENLSLTVIQPNSNVSFTSDKNRIGIGQSVVLSWNVDNARDIEIDNGVGSNLDLIDSAEVYPTTDTTFTLSGFDYSDNPIISSLFVDVVPNSIINSFNASELNITTGESINFNWNVSDSEGLFLSPYGAVSGTPTGTQNITFNTAGDFDFTLESTSLNGTVISSSPIGINVYNPAIINSYTINGVDTALDVSPNDTLNFEWTASNAINYTLNGNSIGGNSTTLTAASTNGITNYVLEAFNGAGDSVTRSLSVNVVGLPIINTFTGPNNVFANTPLTLSWTGTGVSKYEIKSNNATSGISVTEFDLGSSITTNTTPTTAGSYIYTLSAYNTANAKVDLTKSVVVEADPTFTGFTVNGQTSISVSPSAALTYAGTGFSSGATLQARNSSNTANATNPATAPATAGTYTYYASATKTLNSIIRNSNVRSVSVTVVDSPTIGTITAPSPVFANSAFNMTWSGTNVVNYKIRGNVAASGVSTTDVDLGTTANSSITPTSAGTYTYTITATNAAGVTTTSTRNVTVEADPIFTGFTVNGGTSVTVAPSAALTFSGTGFSAGATLQGRNSSNTANAVLPSTAPATAGTYTYYAAAVKTLNGFSRTSSIMSITLTVANANPTITSFVVTREPKTRSDCSIQTGIFSYSYTNTTSLTLYFPSWPDGYAQTTSGKNVTGTTSNTLTVGETTNFSYPNYSTNKWIWTLKACNGANCVTRTVNTVGGECSTGG